MNRRLRHLRAWEFGSSCVLSVSLFTEPVLSDGTALSALTDRSGLANHPVQATGASQPLYKVGVAPSGLPAARFDGSNDELTFPGINLSNYTYIVTSKPTSGGRYAMLGSSLAAGAPSFYSASGGMLYTEQDSQVALASGSVNVSGAWHVASADYVDSSQHIWVDGALHGTGTGVGVGGAGNFNNSLCAIGVGRNGAWFFLGDIADVAVFNAVLSDANRQRFESSRKALYLRS